MREGPGFFSLVYMARLDDKGAVFRRRIHGGLPRTNEPVIVRIAYYSDRRVASDEKIPDDMSVEDKCTVPGCTHELLHQLQLWLYWGISRV